MYQTIFQPLEWGGLTLKNRIIFAPTTLGLSPEQEEQLLGRIAAGGCAMVIVGDVPVGRHGPHSLYHRKGMAYYRRLCAAIHAGGALACAQLHQSDTDLLWLLGQAPRVLLGRIKPEELRSRLNRQAGPYITGLPARKVTRITTSFGPAAKLAREAGFDAIQVHGDRMCGSFSSALLNHRQDLYGGSPEKRSRFAVEAVAAVRRALPDIPIDFKLAVRQENPHYGNAGVLLEELEVFVPRLEAAGVTSFHVTLANHGSLTDTIPPRNHPDFGGQGCFLPFCDRVRQYTKRPLCGVGGLSDPDFIEAQLASGRIDCAAMSRQLIADPDWPQKVRQGQVSEIHRCLRCNRACLGGLQQHQGVHCIYEKENQG